MLAFWSILSLASVEAEPWVSLKNTLSREAVYLSNPIGISPLRLKKKQLMEFKRLPSLSKNKFKVNGLPSKKEHSEWAMLK